jgi:hypothetical protein
LLQLLAKLKANVFHICDGFSPQDVFVVPDAASQARCKILRVHVVQIVAQDLALDPDRHHQSDDQHVHITSSTSQNEVTD